MEITVDRHVWLNGKCLVCGAEIANTLGITFITREIKTNDTITKNTSSQRANRS